MLYGKAYKDYQLNRSCFRKLIRRAYLKNVLKYVVGKAIDFGCGVGELLQVLPPGSVGFEINEEAVKHCRSAGLDVRLYKPEIDRYNFEDISPREFKTFVISHVLEHLEKPAEVMKSIFSFCIRSDIGRVIIIVPGVKGFRQDKTHKTFLDIGSMEELGLTGVEGFEVSEKKYFPINAFWAGNFFTYNELFVVYDKRPELLISVQND